MPRLLDSNVVIALRDGDAAVLARVMALETRPMMSIVSRVELENGVVRDMTKSFERQAALKLILLTFDILDFGAPEADTYRSIVATIGYSRPRTLDRMIAATAMRIEATLVTANVRDFRDIRGLPIEDWSN